MYENGYFFTFWHICIMVTFIYRSIKRMKKDMLNRDLYASTSRRVLYSPGYNTRTHSTSSHQTAQIYLFKKGLIDRLKTWVFIYWYWYKHIIRNL